jgi:putative tricarboxylic transport membrane protein
MIASFIGMDSITGTSRFTFGQIYLYDGINLVWMVVGLFGVSQSFKLIQKLDGYGTNVKIQDYSIKDSVKLVCSDWRNMLRSGLVGTVIGSIPGTGGSVANWVSYDLAKRFSKKPEEFGNGAVSGVIASEAANNGVIGGALIPTLTLGIPGSEVTAILLGGMLIAGIDPGPNLFVKQAAYMYSLTFSIFMSGTMFLLLGIFGAQYFAKVLKMPNAVFAPMIICLAAIGAYSVKQQYYGIVIMFVVGVLAYFLKNTGFPLPPMLIGLILGPIVESNLNRSLILSHGSWSIFVTRPICIVFLFLAVASIAWAAYQAKTSKV